MTNWQNWRGKARQAPKTKRRPIPRGVKVPLSDPLNMLDGVLAQAQHGAMHQFTWPAGSDWTGFEVEKLLQDYGIPVWGRQLALGADQDYGVLVKAAQAHWAEYLLCVAGVPLSSQLLDPRHAAHAQRRGGAMPTPWGVPAKVRGIVGPIVHSLAAVLGVKGRRT